MKLRNKSSNKRKCLTISGIIICTFGIILLLLKIWIIKLLTNSLLVLKPNSLIENVWHKSPPMRTDIYLYNWTNSEEFYNLSIKPKFQELGPYKFLETIEKVDVIWNDNNNTVTYNQLRHYSYDEKAANVNFSQTFITVNVFSLTVSRLARNLNFLIKKAFSGGLLIGSRRIDLIVTLKEALFDGVHNFVLDQSNQFPFIFAELPRFPSFTIFCFSNYSKEFEGTLNMENGADGSFEIRNWNFHNTSPYFSDSCGKVHGSAGEVYSIKKSKKKYIGVFASAICRYMELDFEEEVMVDGVLGYKYIVADRILDNGTLIPGNECYCGDDCVPSGMISVSSCRYGVPVYLSLPHFYRTDPIYLNAIEGLHPTKDKHETYIIVEPTTGILLNASIRLQINMRVQPVEDISIYENVREVFIPIVSADQKIVLPDDIFFLLKICLMLPLLLTVIGSTLFALGFILICIPFKPTFISWFKKLQKQKEIISTTQEQIPLQSCNKIIERNKN